MSDWVSVKDRLPEFNQTVLAFNRSENGWPFFIVATFKKVRDYKLEPHIHDKTVAYFYKAHGYSYSKLTPTHWMPLPEPPAQPPANDDSASE